MQRGILLLGLCALVGLAALAYAEEEPLHENELETKLPDMPWSKDSDAFVVQAPTNGLERLALLAEDDDDEEDDEDEEEFLGDDDSEDDEDDDSSADEELEEQEDWAPIQKRGMHSPNGLKIAAQGGMFSNDGKPPPTSDETKEWIKPGFFAKKRAEAARRAAADPTDLNGAKEARNALGQLKNWAKKHKVSLRNKKKKSPVSKQKNLAKEAEEKITKPRAKGKSQFKPPAPLPDLKIKKLKWAEGHAPHLEPDAEEIRHKKEVARRRAEKEARIARENPWRKEYEQMKVEKKGLHVAAKRFHEEGVRMHKEEIAQNKRWKEEDARLNKIAKNKKMLRRRGAGGRRGKSKRKGKHGRKNKNKRVAEVPPRRADGASEYVHHPSATPSKGRPGLSGVEPQLRAHPAFAANGGPMPGTATHGVPTHFAVSSPDVVKSPNLHEHDDADVEEEAQHLLEQTGGDGEVDVEEMDDMMQAEEDRRANGDAGDWDMDLQLPVAQHVDNERLEDEEEVTEGWETDDF